MLKLAFITRTLVDLGIAQIRNKGEQDVNHLLFFIPICLGLVTIFFLFIALYIFLMGAFSSVIAHLIFAGCLLLLSVLSYLIIALRLHYLEKKRQQQKEHIDDIVKCLVNSYTKSADHSNEEVDSKHDVSVIIVTVITSILLGYLGKSKRP